MNSTDRTDWKRIERTVLASVKSVRHLLNPLNRRCDSSTDTWKGADMTMRKRMHVRSGFAVALLLALILPILAACGNPQPSSSQPPSAASSETAAGTTAAPSPGSGAGQVVTGTSERPSLRIAQATWPDTLAPQKSSFSNEIAVLLLNY